MSVAALIAEVDALLRLHADPERAVPMARYMKDRFPFLGIPAPQRKSLLRDFKRAKGLLPRKSLAPFVRALWRKPEREFQYFAVDYQQYYKTGLPDGYHRLIESCVRKKSWWDTVDGLSAWIAGNYFQAFPGQSPEVTGRWISDKDFWLRRSALLFQLKYKEKTDADMLFAYIRKCSSEQEFFIRKAIGWALREYAKTDPFGVREFVESEALSPLSRREALRHLGGG